MFESGNGYLTSVCLPLTSTAQDGRQGVQYQDCPLRQPVNVQLLVRMIMDRDIKIATSIGQLQRALAPLCTKLRAVINLCVYCR
jgi:hypothetical protein